MAAGVYKSSIASQLAAKDREVRSFIFRTLRAGGNAFRKRIRNERLSGPPGIFSGTKFGTTGMTRDSVQYRITKDAAIIRIDASIGGHAEAHRDKIQFEPIFRQEARNMIDALRPGLQVLLGIGGEKSAPFVLDAGEADFAGPSLVRGNDAKAWRRRLDVVKVARKQAKIAGLKKGSEAAKSFVRKRVARIERDVRRRARRGSL